MAQWLVMSVSKGKCRGFKSTHGCSHTVQKPSISPALYGQCTLNIYLPFTIFTITIEIEFASNLRRVCFFSHALTTKNCTNSHSFGFRLWLAWTTIQSNEDLIVRHWSLSHFLHRLFTSTEIFQERMVRFDLFPRRSKSAFSWPWLFQCLDLPPNSAHQRRLLSMRKSERKLNSS